MCAQQLLGSSGVLGNEVSQLVFANRADHRARLAMLMEATKAIKTLESSHKMEKSSQKMEWGKKKPPAGQPPREPPSQKGLQRILAAMKRKVA